MIVCVTGSRRMSEPLERLVFASLERIHYTQGPITAIVNGGARGADYYSSKWARARGVERVVHYPDWRGHGRAAGPIRNGHMLDTERPHLVCAFPGGAGTRDCVRQAMKRNIPVRHFGYEEGGSDA